MIHLSHQDFYVHEPAKLIDASVIMPIRWFTRVSGQGSQAHQTFWAQAWRLQPMNIEGGLWGYVVHAFAVLEVPAHALSLSLPHMLEKFSLDNSPDPRNIIGASNNFLRIPKTYVQIAGILQAPGYQVFPWTLTDPVLGNRWRKLADGHHVVSFMMWLYCDDTSGNLSKKWNKHNSFLFMAAGLPQRMVHQQSNIHFLCTSNLAPPLDMLDGIVEQLESVFNHFLCFIMLIYVTM